MRVSIFIEAQYAITAHLYVYLKFVLRRAVKIAREMSHYMLGISKFCAYFRYLRNIMHINLRKFAALWNLNYVSRVYEEKEFCGLLDGYEKNLT